MLQFRLLLLRFRVWRSNRIYLGGMTRLADDKLLTLRRRRRVDNLINQVENELVISYLITLLSFPQRSLSHTSDKTETNFDFFPTIIC